MVTRPLKIYGDPAKLRDLIRRGIKRGNGLLAEGFAVRDLCASDWKKMPANSSSLLIDLMMLESNSALIEYENAIDRWDRGLRTSTTKLLGSKAEGLLPHQRPQHRPEGGKDPIEILVEDESHVTIRISELEKLLKRIPVDLPPGVRAEIRPFEDLRLSGLIEEVQLNAYLKRMSTYRTKPQMSVAIGAAKELVEAVLISVLSQLDPEERPDHEFVKLAKQVRRRLDPLLKPNSLDSTSTTTTRLLSGLITIENSLAGLRNQVGTGHGRSHLPVDLSPRHALLARDVAFSYTRYLVLALEEAGLFTLQDSE